MKNIIFIVYFLCIVSIGIAFADEPGAWLRHYKTSTDEFVNAMDKGLADDVKNANDSLVKKGCNERENRECEEIRANYLMASKRFLINAYYHITNALTAGELAYGGSQRDKMTANSLESIKHEVRISHNIIAKRAILNDIAIFYDSNTRRVISREMLEGLKNMEIALNRELAEFAKNPNFNLEEWIIYLKAVKKDIEIRSMLIDKSAQLGAMRTSDMLVCLNSGQSYDACYQEGRFKIHKRFMEPLENISIFAIPQGSIRTDTTPSNPALEDSKKYFMSYQ